MNISYDKIMEENYFVFDKNEVIKYFSTEQYQLLEELSNTLREEQTKDRRTVPTYLVCDSRIQYAEKIAKYIKFGNQYYNDDNKIREKYRLYDKRNKFLTKEEYEANWEKLYDKADEILAYLKIDCKVDRTQKAIRTRGIPEGPYCIITLEAETERESCNRLKELSQNHKEWEFVRVYIEKRKSETMEEKTILMVEYRLLMKKIIAEGL